MDNRQPTDHGPGKSKIDRRSFVRVVGASAVAAPVIGSGFNSAMAGPSVDAPAETAVTELYASLSDKQRKSICFGFNNGKRSEIGANWQITKHRIGSEFYSDNQRHLIDQVIRGVTTEEGYDRFQKQMKSDDKSVDNYSIAIFGEPGSGNFQWELTGRHLTLRADGDSVKGAAFGGPLVYGHGVGNPKRSLFGYQTKVANEVFEALDPNQAEKALLEELPGEHKVELQGKAGKFQGIAGTDLSSDQKDLVMSTIKTIIAPYREADVEEAMKIIEAGGGADSLRMAFYSEGDLMKDKVWDMWRIEGPNLVCHFRGAPHVHAFINIAMKNA